MDVQFDSNDSQFPVRLILSSSTQRFTRKATIELHKKLGEIIEEKLKAGNTQRQKCYLLFENGQVINVFDSKEKATKAIFDVDHERYHWVMFEIQ